MTKRPRDDATEFRTMPSVVTCKRFKAGPDPEMLDEFATEYARFQHGCFNAEAKLVRCKHQVSENLLRLSYALQTFGTSEPAAVASKALLEQFHPAERALHALVAHLSKMPTAGEYKLAEEDTTAVLVAERTWEIHGPGGALVCLRLPDEFTKVRGTVPDLQVAAYDVIQACRAIAAKRRPVAFEVKMPAEGLAKWVSGNAAFDLGTAAAKCVRTGADTATATALGMRVDFAVDPVSKTVRAYAESATPAQLERIKVALETHLGAAAA